MHDRTIRCNKENNEKELRLTLQFIAMHQVPAVGFWPSPYIAPAVEMLMSITFEN